MRAAQSSLAAPPRSLLTLDDALHLDARANLRLHRRHLNPRLARMLRILGADVPAVRAEGSYFWDAEGRRFLDFLSGFGALNLGHNHPAVLRAMAAADRRPTLIEGLNHLAAALAHNLAAVAPAGLERVFFACSGAEAVDAAVKLARGATGRRKVIACKGGFHGRTLGALSLMDRRDYREPFEPLVPGTEHIRFGDLEALRTALAGREAAGFVFEPIQGEAGMVAPPAGYLGGVRELCTRYGTLMIADEIQTGMGRTGTLFAVDREGVAPDVLLLGKALGGGLCAISAALTTDGLFRAARGAGPRSPFHNPTFGGNARACVAALCALNVVIDERLPERAEESGAYLTKRLRDLAARQPLIAGVRGRGLMVGVELASPTKGLATVLTAGALNRLSRSFLSSIVVMQMRREHGVMTAFTLNDPNVLRLQPPLNVTRDEIDFCVDALDSVLGNLRTFSRAACVGLAASLGPRGLETE